MIQQSWRIATLAGIPIRVHVSMLLIVVFIFFFNRGSDQYWLHTLWYLTYVLLLYICVILHEYGHIFAARKYGIGTHDILMLPIGCVARLHSIPHKPWQEIWVAVAGPLVNVVIIALLMPYFIWFPYEQLLALVSQGEPADVLGDFRLLVPMLILGNGVLIAFNMIPAFPMDGGRVLRAALGLRFSRVSATRIAMWLGRVFALAFIVLAFYVHDYFLILIGVFILYTSYREFRLVSDAQRIHQWSLSKLVKPIYPSVYDDEPITQAIKQALLNEKDHFLTLRNRSEQILGFIHKRSFAHVLEEGTAHLPVHLLPTSRAMRVTSTQVLAEVIEKMQDQQISVLTVFNESGQFIGMVDSYDINQVL